MDYRYRINSNFTEVGADNDLRTAKRIAAEESRKYDDIVTIWDGGVLKFVATGGTVYRVGARA